jgi:hypothetical protein
MASLSSMTDAEKEAYAEKLEEKLQSRMIKIAHYDQCVLIEIAATLALNQFQKKYTRIMINRSTLLQEEENHLIDAKTKAWNDRFAAESAAYPPTLERILWIVAKSGFTKEVAPLMNLSKATRDCKNLQRYMREVKTAIVNHQRLGYRIIGGQTQLHYYCEKGMTSSVVRMLGMRSIDVEAKDGVYKRTCLHIASDNGHLAICRLLIDKGAQVEAKDRDGYGRTPLHWAAWKGHVEIVRLLCDRGADAEARDIDGWKPLHFAAFYGHISVVNELIEERNAEINARDRGGETALRYARKTIAAYLIAHGGIS